MLPLPCAHEHVALRALPVLMHLSSVVCFWDPGLFLSATSPCKHRYLFVGELSIGFPISLICCKPVIGLNVPVEAAAIASHPAQLKQVSLAELVVLKKGIAEFPPTFSPSWDIHESALVLCVCDPIRRRPQ